MASIFEWQEYLHDRKKKGEKFLEFANDVENAAAEVKRSQPYLDWEINAADYLIQNDVRDIPDNIILVEREQNERFSFSYGGIEKFTKTISTDAALTSTSSSMISSFLSSAMLDLTDTEALDAGKELQSVYVTMIENDEEPQRLLDILAEKNLVESLNAASEMIRGNRVIQVSPLSSSDLAFKIRTYIEKFKGDLNKIRTRGQVRKNQIWNAVAEELITGINPEDVRAKKTAFLASAEKCDELSQKLTNIGKLNLDVGDERIKEDYTQVIEYTVSMLLSLS